MRNNFDLLSYEFSSPCVIHGSRFIYLRNHLIICVGRAILNAFSYSHMNLLEASFGQSQARTGLNIVANIFNALPSADFHPETGVLTQ